MHVHCAIKAVNEFSLFCPRTSTDKTQQFRCAAQTFYANSDLNGFKLRWPTYRRWQHLTRSSTDRIIRIAPCCTLLVQFRVRTTVAVTCRWVTSPSVCKSAPHPALPTHIHTKSSGCGIESALPRTYQSALVHQKQRNLSPCTQKNEKCSSSESEIPANKSLRRLIEGDVRRQHISSVAA